MNSSTFLPNNNDKTVRTQPATFHIQPHSKQKVAYFHHKDVGNFHFGVSLSRN
jgi:hypothetical protein